MLKLREKIKAKINEREEMWLGFERIKTCLSKEIESWFVEGKNERFGCPYRLTFRKADYYRHDSSVLDDKHDFMFVRTYIKQICTSFFYEDLIVIKHKYFCDTLNWLSENGMVCKLIVESNDESVWMVGLDKSDFI